MLEKYRRRPPKHTDYAQTIGCAFYRQTASFLALEALHVTVNPKYTQGTCIRLALRAMRASTGTALST